MYGNTVRELFGFFLTHNQESHFQKMNREVFWQPYLCIAFS